MESRRKPVQWGNLEDENGWAGDKVLSVIKKLPIGTYWLDVRNVYIKNDIFNKIVKQLWLHGQKVLKEICNAVKN